MTTHDRGKIIAIAEEVKANNDRFGDFSVALYAIAFEDGRQAEREDCAKVCEEHAVYGKAIPSCGKVTQRSSNIIFKVAKAIRARGDSK